MNAQWNAEKAVQVLGITTRWSPWIHSAARTVKNTITFNTYLKGHPLYLRVLLHELAHVVLGHSKVPASTWPWLEYLSREVQADLTSLRACEQLGIECPWSPEQWINEANEYTDKWNNAHIAEVNSAVETIVRAGMPEVRSDSI